MAQNTITPVPFKGQDFEKIKRYLIRTGQRFVDPLFPPDRSSLVYPKDSKIEIDKVVWKRPKDIHPKPKLIVDGVDGNDLNQGALANCWYVASCSALAQKEEVWTQVIPDHLEQEYPDDHPERHPSIFHFRFWHYGQWTDVVVDDYLPTEDGSLYFVHSNDKNEFWCALLEKAYAKIFGCYEALHLGSVTEALEDFTGGVAESVDLWKGGYNKSLPKRLEMFDLMKERIEHGALLGAFHTPQSADDFEKTTPMGIVMSHAYGITGVNTVDTTTILGGGNIYFGFKPEMLKMVRLRNPWGFGEWTGRYGDSSPEWKSISNECKKRIGLVFEDDGEFWMLMEDFCEHYNQMSFCHRVEGKLGTVISLEWTTQNGGGSLPKFPDSFLNNPQICFDVTSEEDEVLLGITVKTGQEQGELKRTQIAIFVFRIEFNREFRTNEIRPVISQTMRLAFTNGIRCVLPQGRYLMIPTTRRPGIERQFLARIFTTKPNHARVLQDLEVEMLNDLPRLITKLRIMRAHGLVNKSASEEGSRLYVVVHCEGNEARSQIVKDTFDPVWDADFIFYRKRPLRNPISVEVWDDMMFLGKHKMIAAELWRNECFELNLLNRDKLEVPGEVYVEITNTQDIHEH